MGEHEVLDPTGAVLAVQPVALNRVSPDRPLRVAVLENGKPNFQRLARMALEKLAATRPLAGMTAYRKSNPAVGARPAMLDEIARSADLVLTGSAD